MKKEIKREQVQTRLKKVFEECGIYIEEDELVIPLELDSLQYITLLVYIEEEFEVVVPESFMYEMELKTYQDFLEMLLMLFDKQ